MQVPWLRRVLCLKFCCHCLDILNFWTRGSAFSFCPGSYKLDSLAGEAPRILSYLFHCHFHATDVSIIPSDGAKGSNFYGCCLSGDAQSKSLNPPLNNSKHLFKQMHGTKKPFYFHWGWQGSLVEKLTDCFIVLCWLEFKVQLIMDLEEQWWNSNAVITTTAFLRSSGN